MACNCKHNQEAIEEFYKMIQEFRDMFIVRMVIQSRNLADIDNVLQCFDDAVKDYRRSFCDVDGCNRK